MHYLDSGHKDPKLSKVPIRCHKGPCGLDLCPWRSGGRSIQTRSVNAGSQKHEPDAVGVVPLSKERSDAIVDVKCDDQKRKRHVRHRDDPASSSSKRQKIDYDERLQTADSDSLGETACFFWYHGRCARSLDTRANYHCAFKHALTDSPSMVQPPPGYVHSEPCGLPWCPGDARNTVKTSERYWENGSRQLRALREENAPHRGSDGDGEDGAKEDWLLSGFDHIASS